ncbi:hypothetical protein N1851_030305 [Merluccius polli]|uniref:Alkylated DNA repair protein AlkB homologue 8 N-terminal domain-containing protein n=1 Tax=Merluccius polli TaxID=89951 RepID=A0AA47NR00_MERPO|nr:hypothetical protein N1851_030305 [Merluccius polli]
MGEDVEISVKAVFSEDKKKRHHKCCVEHVAEVRRIRVFPNRKPWMTKEVQTLIRVRNSAFRTGDRDLYSTARADLRRGLKLAKDSYKRKIEGHLTDAIDSLNDYRPIALTYVIMKCLEQSVSQHIRDCLPPSLDPDQFAYRANRAEVKKLSSWCSDNNLTLNVHKTKELIMDFRKIRQAHTPLLINGEQVETVNTFRFLGTHISADHSWTHNIGVLVKKAQQRLPFLRVLRKNNLDTKLLLAFYHSSVESILTGRLVRRLHSQGQEGSAEGHKHCPKDHRLPSAQPGKHLHILLSQENQGRKITGDPSHPAYALFDLLPSVRRYSVESRLEATEGASEIDSPPPPPPPPPPLPPHPPLPEMPPSPGVTRMVERQCGFSRCSSWLTVLWVFTVITGGVLMDAVVVTTWLARFLSMEPSHADSELSESLLSDRHFHDPSVEGGWITGLLLSGWASTLMIAPVLPEMLPAVLPSELGPVMLITSWSGRAL